MVITQKDDCSQFLALKQEGVIMRKCVAVNTTDNTCFFYSAMEDGKLKTTTRVVEGLKYFDLRNDQEILDIDQWTQQFQNKAKVEHTYDIIIVNILTNQFIGDHQLIEDFRVTVKKGDDVMKAIENQLPQCEKILKLTVS